MSTSGVFIPKSQNISAAWGEVLLALMRKGTTELGPVVVGISEFDSHSMPIEDSAIRTALDDQLLETRGRSIHDVASTIFPIELWNPESLEHQQLLYARYDRIWPRIQKRTRQNARGSYFQRLIAYRGDGGTTINQLEHIISIFRDGNHRRSALQATLFDPRSDHTNTPMLGFPCLQQVAFAPTKDGLEVTGYYVSQFVFDRAYGNYLGLCWLGRFMAQAMELPLAKVYCITSHLILDETKGNLANLAEGIHSQLSAAPA